MLTSRREHHTDTELPPVPCVAESHQRRCQWNLASRDGGMLSFTESSNKNHTPWKINGWNLKITQLKSGKIIWTIHLRFWVPAVNLPGCNISWRFANPWMKLMRLINMKNRIIFFLTPLSIEQLPGFYREIAHLHILQVSPKKKHPPNLVLESIFGHLGLQWQGGKNVSNLQNLTESPMTKMDQTLEETNDFN